MEKAGDRAVLGELSSTLNGEVLPCGLQELTI